ncbi:coproporphyrinogen III oxidase [Planctomycetales bacterium]|nr:coproporphyrinogen III oxidase [Planctomycetales bacterium]GHS97666.1 coproporphyrinogen III oxidase [Planctomycetales bacterium]GHT03466.1 coproporphyrinogen III oxidase [Planctomycetales bacterium]
MPALYVHIPFCVSRCDYCDFNRVVYDRSLADAYLAALEKEISTRVTDAPTTIYIGGGTPTSLNREQLEKLFSLFDFLDLSTVVEWTVEANPGTLSVDKLILLRDAGVTRVSLGVQSFRQAGLDTLGRRHSAKAAKMAVALLQETAFAMSLDLIFGYPGQTPDDWRDDLQTAVKTGAEHLSCYGLTYADGTPLREKIRRGKLTALGENAEYALFALTPTVLASAGLARYEISNFARAGKTARHNLNYWQGGEYLGVGAGAHSYQSDERFENYGGVREYIDAIHARGDAVAAVDKISATARAKECGVIWLRLTDGIDSEQFARRTGFNLRDLWREQLPELLDGGWLEWRGNFLRLTDHALPLADSVLVELV